ncbi:MAG: molybdopterin molybdotransferase MoeA [Armatimonadetes bacterium]|nr:molybdopterin molybdotransferase MoeA [Armatimonadota bacterium]
MTYYYFGGKPLIAFEEALRLLLESAHPIVRTETVPLERASRRIVAEDVRALQDIPSHPRSAMDGYAVRSQDIQDAAPNKPVPLIVQGALFAGADPSVIRLEPNKAVRIATGAPLPDGADTVIPFEEVVVEDHRILVSKPLPVGKNITEKGADVTAGSVVLRGGADLSPARLAVAAGLGRDRLQVYAKPRVAIVSSGEEIQRPGEPLRPGQVYDMNSFSLMGLVANHGGDPVLMPNAPDTEEGLTDALDCSISECDVVVFSAGSSVGERDLMPKILSRRGEVLFHGVAIRPGRPTLAAVVNDRLVINLPGFPTSCLMVAYVLLVPVLRKIARLPQWQPRSVPAILDQDVTSPNGLRQFLSVRLIGERATVAYKESTTITSLTEADGYIDIPAATTFLPAGEPVSVILFD